MKNDVIEALEKTLGEPLTEEKWNKLTETGKNKFKVGERLGYYLEEYTNNENGITKELKMFGDSQINNYEDGFKLLDIGNNVPIITKI